MTAGLKIFAKVRALHGGATIPGKKPAELTRMQTLARKAGMSVGRAVSKMGAPRNLFEELFDTPEFRAQSENGATPIAGCPGESQLAWPGGTTRDLD